MSVSENLKQILEEIPSQVTLVAVSKTKPVELIQEAYEAGQRDFGENYIQELVAKQGVLPADIRWHFIGHLQTNKVKYIVPFVHLIHGVDSFKLLIEIDKQAKKAGRVVDVLLQIHIAKEESKFGFDKTEALQLLHGDLLNNFSNIKIKGLMGMSTNTDDLDLIKEEFSFLSLLFEELKAIGNMASDFQILSMGMSNDYTTAIQKGSNLIRIGSLIFGSR